MSEPLVDWREVLKLLGLSDQRALKKLLKAGMPVYKINSRVLRVKISEVEEWLKTKKD